MVISLFLLLHRSRLLSPPNGIGQASHDCLTYVFLCRPKQRLSRMRTQKRIRREHQRKRKNRRRRQIMPRQLLSSPRLAKKLWCAPLPPHPQLLSLHLVMTTQKTQHLNLQPLMTVLATQARQRTVQPRSQAKTRERRIVKVVQFESQQEAM